MNTEEVRLSVPALPEYVRLARLTAASLASRLGFSFDDVEDLRIAVDELCYLLVGPEGRPGHITLRYSLDGTGLAISGQGPGADSAVVVGKLSEQILAAVVDDYQVSAGEGQVTFEMVRRPHGA